MNDICDNIRSIEDRIETTARRFNRSPENIKLLAVSKTWPAEVVRTAWHCGQRCFGENYVNELIDKAKKLEELDIEWHFIGHLQSNKSRAVAETADWVHSVDRLSIAKRLSAQRDPHRPPLQVCVQINVSEEASKSGIKPAEALPLLHQIRDLPNLRLRGLMTIPAKTPQYADQRAAFARLRELFEQANRQGLQLDTLSMGMSNDFAAAIAEGTTVVRVGTAIFGERVAAPQSLKSGR